MKRRVLVVSPAFAPCGLVGAARMTSLVDYLSKEGAMDVTVVSYGKGFFQDSTWNRRVPAGIKLIQIEHTAHMSLDLFRVLVRIIKKGNYDVCVSSMGPYTTLPYLWIICNFMRLPLVLDFRDPWIPEDKQEGLLRDCIKRIIERCNVRHVQAIVSVTERNTLLLSERYSRYSYKMKTIFNGHDDLSCYKKKNRSPREEYKICCVGKCAYYNKNAMFNLLTVIEELRSEEVDISFYHIGEQTENASVVFNRHFLGYYFCGPMQYEDAMKILAEMDAAVIVNGPVNALGTKVFDYIGFNLPIIYSGIIPCELTSFLLQFDNTVISDNKAELKEEIRELAKKRVICLNRQPTGKYLRRNQNKSYLDLLLDISRSRARTE